MPFHNKITRALRKVTRPAAFLAPQTRFAQPVREFVPGGRQAQNLAIGTVASSQLGPVAGPLVAGAGTSALDTLTGPGGGESPVADPTTASGALGTLADQREREAFERAAAISLEQSRALARERGRAQATALGSAGLAGSPLAAGQIATQRRLAEESALDRITQARLGLEQGIAGRDFQREMFERQLQAGETQFNRQQNQELAALFTGLGLEVLSDPELRDAIGGVFGDLGELFGLGSDVDVNQLLGSEPDIGGINPSALGAITG